MTVFCNIILAVTKSGMGTWGLGRGDVGTRARVGTGGRGT